MYPLRNSRIVRYNSGIGGQSRNSYFAQDNSGIVPIPTLRRTYICSFTKINSMMRSLHGSEQTVAFASSDLYTWRCPVLTNNEGNNFIH